MKINSDDDIRAGDAVSDLFDSSQHTMCKLETTPVSNNASRRMMSQSMLAYSQRMQHLSNLRKDSGISSTLDTTRPTLEPQLLPTDRATHPWLTRNTPTTVKTVPLISGAHGHVGRKWVTLQKLHKSPAHTPSSLADTPWGNYSRSSKPLNTLSAIQEYTHTSRLSPITKTKPRSKSVLDLVVRNYSDNRILDAPLKRPNSEQNLQSPTEYSPGRGFVHPATTARTGFFSPSDSYMLDSPIPRGETNVLTLPDIAPSDTTMDASAIQIVPFPAITELQAVPAKLHTSQGASQNGARKPHVAVEMKARPAIQKPRPSKDSIHEISTDTKGSVRLIPANTEPVNANSTTVSVRTLKAERTKTKSLALLSDTNPIKPNKEGIVRTDICTNKEKITIPKTKRQVTNSTTGSSERVIKSPQTAIARKKQTKTDRTGSRIKNVDNINKEKTPLSNSSLTPCENGNSDSEVAATARYTPTTTTTSVLHIKSVLKKQRTSDDAEGELRPAAIQKTVQFGPKMIREVTKIVYPWNVNNASSSDEEDYDNDDDDTTNDEQEDTEDDDEGETSSSDDD